MSESEHGRTSSYAMPKYLNLFCSTAKIPPKVNAQFS